MPELDELFRGGFILNADHYECERQHDFCKLTNYQRYSLAARHLCDRVHHDYSIAFPCVESSGDYGFKHNVTARAGRRD